MTEQKKSLKFLIVQLRKLGDVLLTTPVIDVLHEKYPDACIDFFTETPFYDVVSDNPKIRNVFLLEKKSISNQFQTLRKIRQQKYDYVLDFFGNPRSAWWAFFSGTKCRIGYDYPGRKYLYNKCVKRDRSAKYVVDFKMDLLTPLGITTNYKQTSLYVSENIKKKMGKYLEDSGWKKGNKLVGIVTPNNRTLSKVKNWRIDGFIELINRIQKDLNSYVLLLWGPGEEEELEKIRKGVICDKLIISPKMNIKELAGIISYTSLVVTACGGSKHIAVSQHVPTITIFGPTQEKCWNPKTDMNLAVKANDLECLECDKTECETLECMEQVSTDMVFRAVCKLINLKVNI